MQATGAIADNDSMRAAVESAFAQAASTLAFPISLVLVFVDPAREPIDGPNLLRTLKTLAPGVPIFGCSAASNQRDNDLEPRSPTASILLIGGLSASPQVIRMECVETPDGPSVLGIDEEALEAALRCNGMLVLASARSFSIQRLMASIRDTRAFELRADHRAPLIPIFGGYLGEPERIDEPILLGGDQVIRSGAIGLVIPDELQWKLAVSQGCRPIGDPMIVTKVDGAMILGLGGKPALEQLHSMFRQLPNCEKELAISSLLIGRAISEYSPTFSFGEFLVRNVSGVDTEAQGITVTDRFHVGQTVRFHIPDRAMATADLSRMLQEISAIGSSPLAGLVLSCRGRGTDMFGHSNHDVSQVLRSFPTTPIAGCFVAGEFAPLHGENLVHGFAAVVALLDVR